MESESYRTFIMIAVLLISLIIIIVVLRLNLIKKTAETGIGGTEAVKTMVTLKYYSNFWRALEMSLISCENNLICYRCKPRKIIRND